MPVRAIPTVPQTSRGYPALTGLRGLGAAWVFAFHWNVFQSGASPVPGMAHGYLGVDMFFLLSGFIMAHSKYLTFTATGFPATYGRFAAERLARLFPTNAAVLALYGACVFLVPSVGDGWDDGTFTGGGFLRGLFLVQSWSTAPMGWIVPGWSLSVEIAAYACLPVVLLLARRAHHPVWLAAGCLAAFALVILLNGGLDPNVKNRGGFIRVAFEFTAGVALYEAHRRGHRIPSGPGTCAVLCLLALAVTLPAPAAFLALPAFAILVPLAARPGFASRVLETAPLQFLGRVSYSFYLIQWPVLMFWAHYHGMQMGAAANAAMTAGTVGLAACVYYCVEAPSHGWARLVAKRARPERRNTAIAGERDRTPRPVEADGRAWTRLA